MPQPKKGPRLGSNPKHQRHLLANLAGSLFEHERIRTTEAKAKALRPFAEKLITKAKKGDVHNRRQVLSVIENRDIVHKLFDDIAPRFNERNGGYTRILKIGPRAGDGAPMALVELVEEGEELATTVETPEGRKRRLARPGARRKTKDETPAAETTTSEEADAEVDTPEPELHLEDEGADEGAETPDEQDEQGEAQQEGAEASAEAATAQAEEAGAEAQADAGDAPSTGGEGVKDQK